MAEFDPQQLQQLVALLRQQQETRGASGFGSINDLSQLATPEQLTQMMGLGTMDERGSLLKEQLAQADALRGEGRPQATTKAGAIWGGLGDALGNAFSSYQKIKLGQQQEALLNKQDAGRATYMDLLREMDERRRLMNGMSPGSAGMGDRGPSSPFGIG